jgi:hypothetical protein
MNSTMRTLHTRFGNNAIACVFGARAGANANKNGSTGHTSYMCTV